MFSIARCAAWYACYISAGAKCLLNISARLQGKNYFGLLFHTSLVQTHVHICLQKLFASE